jgi:hypothetical protein
MLTETLLRIPFTVVGRCFLMPNSQWLPGKCAAFVMIIQNYRRLSVCICSVKIAALGSKRQKIVKAISASTECACFIIISLKSIFIS